MTHMGCSETGKTENENASVYHTLVCNAGWVWISANMMFSKMDVEITGNIRHF